MGIKKDIKANRKERTYFFKIVLFSLLLILCSNVSLSQDSIPAKKDLTEEKELKFQQYFFKALSEKAIGNHKRAIENLENCNQILPNNGSVFFEFSKNYLALNNTLLAKAYIDRALQKDLDNIWMLKLLVEIYKKSNSLKDAIAIQERVIDLNPKEKSNLVRLYLYNRDYQKAIDLLGELEKKGVLDAYLRNLKKNLESRNSAKKTKIALKNIADIIKEFNNNKEYKTLEKLLQKSNDNEILLKYSEEGIVLFPAQPFVYLVNGSVLNYQKNHKKALSILKNGIDFVIDEKMEAKFYVEIAKAYKGLGNKKEEKKYNLKAKKVKI